MLGQVPELDNSYSFQNIIVQIPSDQFAVLVQTRYAVAVFLEQTDDWALAAV